MQIKLVIKYAMAASIVSAVSVILPHFLNTSFLDLQPAIAKDITFPMLPLESQVYFATQRYRQTHHVTIELVNATDLSRMARDHSNLILENNGSTTQSQQIMEQLQGRSQQIAIAEGSIDCDQTKRATIPTEWVNNFYGKIQTYNVDADNLQDLLLTNFNATGIGIMRNSFNQCYITQIFIKS